jgi:hypothetical protein
MFAVVIGTSMCGADSSKTESPAERSDNDGSYVDRSRANLTVADDAP